MASAVTTPLERQFGQMPSLAQMTSVSSFGSSQITLQFTLDRDIDAAAAGRPGRDQRGVEPVAAHAAGAADLLEEQPRRSADPDARGQLGHAAARRRSTTSPTRCSRRRSRRSSGVGLVTIGGGQKPAVRVQVDPQSRSPAPGSRSRTCATRSRPPTSTSRRATSTAPRQDWALATNDQLDERGELRAADHRVQERRAGPARRGRERDRRRRERAARRLGRHASARSSSTSSASPARTSSRSPTTSRTLLPQLEASMPQAIDVDDPRRSHRDRARVGRRRPVHAGADDRASSSP